MTNDTNKILATKKAWRTAERRKGQRRAKDGTPEDRKTTADAIRRGREIEQDSMRPGFWKKIMKMFIPVILIAIIATPAHAYTDKQAIKAVIGEAENQGYEGMLAVACAIRKRGTLKGVYGLHAPRVKAHRYTARIYSQAARAWAESAKMDITHGAKFWENTTAFGVPYWAHGMKVTLVIKDHKFFR